MRYAIALAVACMVAACGASAPPPVPARPLTSPGPLTAGHATIACLGCHAGESPKIDDAKCLACHAPLRAQGLHAAALVRSKPCMTCHLDHRGAAYDALGWASLSGGSAKFDHALSGWKLEGAHRTVDCSTCHTKTSPLGRPTFAGADRACSTCHVNQPHGFQRSALLSCERCHTTARWAPPKRTLEFDHDSPADARMALRGAHRDVACAACHPKGGFSSHFLDPARCENCHLSPHVDRPFDKVACGSCHDEFSFKQLARFDHTERTRFDLGASHRKVACATCHTPALGGKLPPAACEACHAARSPHKDRFKAFGTPAKCGLCHAPSSAYDPATPTVLGKWRPGAFNHAKATGWPLFGMHGELACRQCHAGATPDVFDRLPSGKACMGCHAHAKVHADADHPKGKYTDKQCLMCHVAPGSVQIQGL